MSLTLNYFCLNSYLKVDIRTRLMLHSLSLHVHPLLCAEPMSVVRRKVLPPGFLGALPIEQYGFTLRKTKFTNALCLHYGWTPHLIYAPLNYICGKAFSICKLICFKLPLWCFTIIKLLSEASLGHFPVL